MIGSDAEVFLKDRVTGQLVSAIGKLGGSKDMPRPFSICTIQEDNVLAEFNIPPASTKEEFASSMHTMLTALSDLVSTMGLEIDIRTSAYMPMSQLQHPMARRFGCDPDFNAYTGSRNPAPNAQDSALRTASGHVHIDLPNCDANPDHRLYAVRLCDLLLGMYDKTIDEDTERRQLYGKAGAFRPTKYGIEYRTMGNQWLRSSQTCERVFELASIVSATNYPTVRKIVSCYDSDEVQSIINQPGNKEKAQSMLNGVLKLVSGVSRKTSSYFLSPAMLAAAQAGATIATSAVLDDDT